MDSSKVVNLLLPIMFSLTLQLSTWLCRLCVDNCFSFFVSGVIVSSSFLLANPIAYSLNKENLKLNYPCEDVRSYYSGVDGLRGAALMKDLGSLVSDHKSLPYKEVGDCNLVVFLGIIGSLLYRLKYSQEFENSSLIHLHLSFDNCFSKLFNASMKYLKVH